MKRLFILIVAMSLLISAGAYARSPVSGGKDYLANADFISAYNASGTAMTSGTIVILASTGAKQTNYSSTQVATGTTLGAYVTTTEIADNPLVIGVVDDDEIASGGVGRVQTSGPARVRISTATSIVPGTLIGTATTAGQGDIATATYAATIGVLGVALDNVEASSASNNGQGVWIWIFPH